MTKETIKFKRVDVLNVPKASTFIFNGELHVNSPMMPPPGSKPLDASKIIITTQPEYNQLEGEVLTIDYPASSACCDAATDAKD